MKNAGGQHGIGMALQYTVGQMLQIADSAAGDNGNADGLGHGGSKLNIKPAFRAVAVYAGEQYLAGTQRLHLDRPIDRVESCRDASAMRIDLPVAAPVVFGIYRHDDALRTEPRRGVSNETRIGHRRGVNTDLVGARIEQATHIADLAHATADGERDEHRPGYRFNNRQNQIALLDARGNIQESKLVCSFPNS